MLGPLAQQSLVGAFRRLSEDTQELETDSGAVELDGRVFPVAGEGALEGHETSIAGDGQFEIGDGTATARCGSAAHLPDLEPPRLAKRAVATQAA